MQTGYLTDLNWCTLEQVLTIRYGLLGRRLSLRVWSVWFVCAYTHVRKKWNMNANLISCSVWYWYLLSNLILIFVVRTWQTVSFLTNFSVEIPLHWQIVRQSEDYALSDQAAPTCFGFAPDHAVCKTVLLPRCPTARIPNTNKRNFCRPVNEALSFWKPFSD